MKVTQIICPVKFGGGEKIIKDLSILLRERKIDSDFILLSKSVLFESVLENERFSFYRKNNIDLGSSPRIINYFYCLILSIINLSNKKTHTCDIIIAHGFPANIFCIFKSLFSNKKLIYINHSNKGSMSKLSRLVYLQIFKRFDKIISVSSRANDSFFTCFPELISKQVSIPNGIDTCLYKYKKRVYKKFMTGVYVARFSDVKNHELIVRAMEEHKNFNMYFIGDGEKLDEIKKIIDDKGLSSRAKFLGHQSISDVLHIYDDVDFCLFPSLSEGFGLSIAEAICSGLPIVLYENVYLNEFGDGCFISKDENEFIYNVGLLLNNENLFNDSTKEHSKARFMLSIDRTINSYSKLIYELREEK